MMDRGAYKKRLAEVDELVEERFLDGFHQQVQKKCEKA